MDALVPFLIAGLQNYEAFQVCTIIVGLLGDICRSIENDVTKYCSDIMTSLVRLLQDNHLHRSVKPPVLSCFGDIAMAIGPQFEPFLPMCLFMLSSAGSMQIPQDDEDLIEYLQTLREAILEGYTGIIQGLRDGGRIDLMKPENIGNIISLLTTIADESDKDEEVVNKALGLLG
jgi:importin subunit beta-1